MRNYEELLKRANRVLSWKEYACQCDLGHWHWNYDIEAEDQREFINLGRGYWAYGVYPRDILEDLGIRVVYLPNNLLAISWDNFREDVEIVKDEYDGEPIGWLLVEQLGLTEFRTLPEAPCPFPSLQVAKKMLKWLTLGEAISLPEFLKTLSLEKSQKEKLFKLLAEYFGITRIQVVKLLIDKDGWVFQEGEEEKAQHLDYFLEKTGV